MHARLGRKADAGLEIDVRGSASARVRVLVDGRPAACEGKTFAGTAIMNVLSLRRSCPAAVCFFLIWTGLALAAPARDEGLVGHWPFDECRGVVSADAGPLKRAARLSNAAWARGAFGSAIKTGPSNSKVVIPPLPELDGSKEMTLSVWVYWETPNGQYPNILTTGWGSGGFMLFVNGPSISFRIGRREPGDQNAGRPWREGSVGVLSGIPTKTWTHIAVSFKQPEIATYVNGRLASKGKWDDPISTTDEIVLGQWNTRNSHDGLIDELRIYNRALAPDEITALAQSGTRAGAREYQTVLDGVLPQPILTLETRCAKMIIGDNAAILSLAQKGAEPRELIDGQASLVEVVTTAGRKLRPLTMKLENGLLVCDFPNGRAKVRATAEGEYFKFTAEELTVPDAEAFTFVQFTPTCVKYVGSMAGLASDDESGVCLRSLSLAVDCVFGLAFCAKTTAEHGLTGHSAALAAGPRAELIPMMQSMVGNEKVPKSLHGGPWAASSELARLSYLFVFESFDETEFWIEMARRGGFGIIHFREPWYTTLGTYKPAEKYFPNGLDDMVAIADKIHAAGLKLGLHTLTGCIHPIDPLVSPVPPADLIASARYTLAKPMSEHDTTMYVHEEPIPGHHLVWTYSGNGNAMRIGTEIIRYSQISREPPYAFLECERGAFKTVPQAHPRGAEADYLQQRYLAFYPNPDSKLADRVAENIAKVYNACKADFIYLDGSEGMRSRYGIDAMRWKIFSKLHGGMSEASCWGHNSWWFHSRLGAWDSTSWGWKRFHDRHIESVARHRPCDLLEPQLGWWWLNGPDVHTRGQFIDETEYFAAKNLAIDAPMSINGIAYSRSPANGRALEMLTILGWYEQHRLANYFDAATVAAVGEPGKDVRLRLDSAGHWRFTPAHMRDHRITAVGNGSETWTVNNPHGEQPFRGRIEALYTVAPANSAGAMIIADFSDLANLGTRRTAANVTQTLSVETADTRGGTKNLRIEAANRGDSADGAWLTLETTHPYPYFSLEGNRGLGIWVKGDGSGAILAVQLRPGSEFSHACSDHFIDLDFTGWRYVELLFRERDSARLRDYSWPDDKWSHGKFKSRLDIGHIRDINLLVNAIPAKGAVDIVVGPLVSLPVQKYEMKDIALVVNGKPMLMPVAMTSGDYIELEGPDGAALFTEAGTLVQRFTPRYPDGEPLLKAGGNELAFHAKGAKGPSTRAMVTTVALGEPFGTRNENVDWSRLKREYELPRVITAMNGVDNRWTFTRRDEGGASLGDDASIEIEIGAEQIGGAANGSSAETSRTADDVKAPRKAPAMMGPTVTINGEKVHFPVSLLHGDSVVCRDGVNWVHRDRKGKVCASGRLEAPVPAPRPGVNEVSLNFDRPDSQRFRATVNIVKAYP